VLPEMKIIKGIMFNSTGYRSRGPYWAAVMDIQMSMIRDIMICREPLTSSPKLIVFLCLMRSSSFPPARHPSNFVDIY